MKKLHILFMIILFISLQSCSERKGIEADATRNICEAQTLMKEQLADLLYTDSLPNIQFIDIRTPHDYSVSHIPGAVNIPVKSFFNKSHWTDIDKDKILIIYGYDASTPQLIALMSHHFGKANLYVALGGYDYIKKHILDGYGIYSGIYYDEEPVVPFRKKLAEIRSRAGAQAVSKQPAKSTSPVKPAIKKRKKKPVSGGCG